jgi:hypothetical protein
MRRQPPESEQTHFLQPQKIKQSKKNSDGANQKFAQVRSCFCEGIAKR